MLLQYINNFIYEKSIKLPESPAKHLLHKISLSVSKGKKV